MSWEPTQLEEQRLSKLAALQEAGIDPFPIHVERSHKIAEAVELFLAKEGQEGGKN
jgi:lysyl-tRNA synthetase class II